MEQSEQLCRKKSKNGNPPQDAIELRREYVSRLSDYKRRCNDGGTWTS